LSKVFDFAKERWENFSRRAMALGLLRSAIQS
jgi:hypothetical protein